MKFFQQYQRQAIRIGLSLALLAMLLMHISGWLAMPFIQQMEHDSYDARLRLLMPQGIDTRVVIVDIDEKSLKELGRWPWGRDKLASLVNQLFDHYHINTLGFDVVFAEKDDSSGLQALMQLQSAQLKGNQAFADALARLRKDLDYDAKFAQSLKNRKVVLGYYFSNNPAESVGQLPPASLKLAQLKNQSVPFTQYMGYGANLKAFQQAAMASGHFVPEVDADGISRRVAMLSQYQDQLYEPLSLAVARIALGAPPITPGFASNTFNKSYHGLEWLQIGTHKIPLDAKGTALVPFRGKQGSFKYVSAADVIQGKVDARILKDSIVLVGTTASGLLDLRATPVQNVYAGVEIHANLIAGILDNTLLQQPAYSLGAEFMLVLLIGLFLIWALPKLNPLQATLLTVSTVFIIVVCNLICWKYAHLVLPLATPLLLVGLLYVLNMSYGFFVESRGNRQLTHLFGQYVPPDLVKEMANNPEYINVAGESRDMSVLFSDVRGFTSIAENMQPQALTQLMNAFLSPITQVIHEHRGTIDKYMGDAVMAFWGAPLKDNQHATHAIEAALAMQAALVTLNQTFAQKNWPAIQIGIGINTGLMTVGNMGSNFRMVYTVMGDAVNLGARLETLTKTYGVPIIVSEFTKAQAPQFLYRELDTVQVKGKAQFVKIYQPLCKLEQATPALKDELQLHHAALKHYYNKHYDLAELQWLQISKGNVSLSPYNFYMQKKV